MPAASPAAGWVQRCGACATAYPLGGPVWRCDCGGLLDADGPPPVALIGDPRRWSMWRYAPALPPVPAWEAVTLGEGMTPVVDAAPGVVLKLDFLNPTLSFKDRGAVTLVAGLVAGGARRLVADSSGNAGTAVAAYAARAGVPAEIWVPDGTSGKKTAAMRAHGAEVHVVDGDRQAAAVAAAERVADTGASYASHVYQPLFTQGVKTYVFELWEQLGERLPDTLVVPAGNGTLVLGAAFACADLLALGLVGAVPRLVAVQAEQCAPLAGLRPRGATVAEGIAIAHPPRAASILAAVAASGGEVVTVTEAAIDAARRDLAARGLWVEPTGAVGWAAWCAGVTGTGPSTAIVLCGAGLKAG